MLFIDFFAKTIKKILALNFTRLINPHYLAGFLGDWFILKATWASAAQVKQNAASLKKFYTFLLQKNTIEKETFSELKAIIKEELPNWAKMASRW